MLGGLVSCLFRLFKHSCYFPLSSLRCYSDAVSVLAELFPKACSLELEHCLRVANGDTESAVQLMLLKGTEDNKEEGKENCGGILDFSPKVREQSFPLQFLVPTLWCKGWFTCTGAV